MLEETGFIAHEEGDEFLILTCPKCGTDIIFTQRADPVVIREAAGRHAGRCGVNRLQCVEVALAGR